MNFIYHYFNLTTIHNQLCDWEWQDSAHWWLAPLALFTGANDSTPLDRCDLIPPILQPVANLLVTNFNYVTLSYMEIQFTYVSFCVDPFYNP